MNSVTYILYTKDVKHCLLIDCGDYSTLRPFLEEYGLEVKLVLLTHGHSDHIMGISELLKDYPNVEICTNEEGHQELCNPRKNLSFYHGLSYSVDCYNKVLIHDKDILQFEGIGDIEVIATPGHDESCLTYKIGKNLFTGDSYIPGLNVFTKFPRGNKEKALASRNKIMTMEKEGYIIYCGHHSYDNLKTSTI